MIQQSGNPTIQKEPVIQPVTEIESTSSNAPTIARSTGAVQKIQNLPGHQGKISTNILNAPIDNALTAIPNGSSDGARIVASGSVQTQPAAKSVIDFSVPSTVVANASVTPAPGTLLPGHEQDLDLPSTGRLLESATFCFNRRDFKACARLIEKALPAIDRLYNENAAEKLQALQLLRDSYLALNKGVEAKDCAEVIIAVFEDIMAHNHKSASNFTLGTPLSQTRLVVRKLKTIRRAKDSEFLRKTATEVSERWALYLRA